MAVGLVARNLHQDIDQVLKWRINKLFVMAQMAIDLEAKKYDKWLK